MKFKDYVKKNWKWLILIAVALVFLPDPTDLIEPGPFLEIIAGLIIAWLGVKE